MPEEQKLNSATEKGQPDPAPQPNPDSGKESANQDAKWKALEEEISTLKRQYKGSSEEALRLKEELDKLKSSASTKIDEQSFQKRVEEVGLAQATSELLDSKLESIRTKTESLFKEKVDNTLASFKQKHPGLTGDALAKFDAEFARLKKVYDSPEDAMEAAYRVIGGESFDKAALDASSALKEKQDSLEKSEKQKEALSQKASGGEADSRPTPPNTSAELTNQINSLTHVAITYEANGRDSTEIWAKIDNLKTRLASKAS